MGYHVRIDETSKALLENLAEVPSKIFKKQYCAYLLFLVTQHDRQQLDWLVCNAPGLDSLTGQHLAYAIFAKSFPVRIRTDATRSWAESELAGKECNLVFKNIPPELLKRPNEVVRLVENGAFGVVLDEDELTAITYGSDLVARELGVLDKLPCLVVLDAVPSNSPLVIPLTQKLIPELIQRLRGALSRFYSVGGQTTIRKLVDEIQRIQSRIDVENSHDADIRRRIARANSNIANARERLINIEESRNLEGGFRDPSYYYELIANQESILSSLKQKLAEFPSLYAKRLAELEKELSVATADYRDQQEKTFPHCLTTELRTAGLLEGVSSVKSHSMSFLSQLFKPEFLLKIWKVL
jgi:hypothetical protein